MISTNIKRVNPGQVLIFRLNKFDPELKDTPTATLPIRSFRLLYGSGGSGVFCSPVAYVCSARIKDVDDDEVGEEHSCALVLCHTMCIHCTCLFACWFDAGHTWAVARRRVTAQNQHRFIEYFSTGTKRTVARTYMDPSIPTYVDVFRYAVCCLLCDLACHVLCML